MINIILYTTVILTYLPVIVESLGTPDILRDKLIRNSVALASTLTS